jgi:hypothetical protein
MFATPTSFLGSLDPRGWQFSNLGLVRRDWLQKTLLSKEGDGGAGVRRTLVSD